MTRFSHIALIALAAFGVSTSLAEAGKVGSIPWIPGSGVDVPAGGFGAGSGTGGGSTAGAPEVRAVRLACIVGGTPSEFPNDIWITNTTHSTILKGTALTFSIPAVGVKGSFLIPANLPAGQQLKIADIFGGAEAGSPCSVKFA